MLCRRMREFEVKEQRKERQRRRYDSDSMGDEMEWWKYGAGGEEFHKSGSEYKKS